MITALAHRADAKRKRRTHSMHRARCRQSNGTSRAHGTVCATDVHPIHVRKNSRAYTAPSHTKNRDARIISHAHETRACILPTHMKTRRAHQNPAQRHRALETQARSVRRDVDSYENYAQSKHARVQQQTHLRPDTRIPGQRSPTDTTEVAPLSDLFGDAPDILFDLPDDDVRHSTFSSSASAPVSQVNQRTRALRRINSTARERNRAQPLRMRSGSISSF